MNLSIGHALKELDHSLYLVEGEGEPNSDSVIQEYKSVNAAIETVKLNRTKHLPQLEDPEQFLEQVGIFF